MITWNDICRLADEGTPPPARRVEKSDREWRQLLTEEHYRVTRTAGTERPFSSALCTRFEPGTYGCVCCGEPLFNADTKFDSHSGWPSFTQPLTATAVAYRWDASLGMTRIEVLCNTCDAHLGHVFPDGPAPWGTRYCMNGIALKKVS
ncbi:peptide-methionine (R)-S-oxide reductase [Alkalispirochaeta americana]|uniref:peptide-methionine (R)-S-oxide reductase n=1 Tax=Alkalispirochaeta americana TaxID=159291 RepID=A0A1N6RG88_9SPIO|nr:peptide-methionine (R)-S-oxide reductase MsrB [Alkalispirochaeta americana]SIQ27873.1 peptide-methionine (R)-S-oxide reductase [Alkalispirochaeta americana]